MRMSALRSGHLVTSFRTARLSGALKEMLDKVHVHSHSLCPHSKSRTSAYFQVHAMMRGEELAHVRAKANAERSAAKGDAGTDGVAREWL